MLEKNKIYCCDVLEGLKQLDDESVDLIITSPPYNLKGFNGKVSYNEKHDLWHRWIKYGGQDDLDNIPEEEYEQWQVDILNECYRVLKKDGSMFYNHKLRIKKQQISHPILWIMRSNFKCRQEIIWDRNSSICIDNNRYLPVTERIYWLCKTAKNPRFKRNKNSQFVTDVWRFPPDKNNDHPAPFPITLPDNIIPNVAQGERILVLDPFMGGGTVAMSAIKNGCDYIGFDIVQEYVDMAEKRINNFLS